MGRIIANGDLFSFELTQDDMVQLDELKKHKMRLLWNPMIIKWDDTYSNTSNEEEEKQSAVFADMLFSVEAMNAKDELGTGAKILKDMIATDPTNSELHYRLAVIAKRQWKNFDQAKDEFLLAIKYDSNHALSLFGLADLYKNQLSNYEEAKKYFELTVKAKPSFGIGWKEYADLLGWRLGDWKGAVDAYEESVKYNHRYLWNCYNNMAWGLANKLGDYAKSEICYKKSLEINNNNITWANFGKLYMDFLKNDVEAERCFRESLKAKEATSGAHVFLGQVLSKRVDDVDAVDEAKKHLVRSLELGDTRGKDCLAEIIKREQAELATDDDEKVENEKQEEKENKKIEFFSNNDRVINILERPSEAIIASSDNKILCSGDASGNIVLYDLTSLNENDFNNTPNFDFFQIENTNCNEIQFSHNGKYLAAAFFDEKSRNSKLVIWNIEKLSVDGLSVDNIALCAKPIQNIQLSHKINTNAMQFTANDEYVMIGLQIYFPNQVPFYSVKLEDGKLDSTIYAKVLMKQATLQVAKNESISSLDCVGNILLCGTTMGRVFLIDVVKKKLLYTY